MKLNSENTLKYKHSYILLLICTFCMCQSVCNAQDTTNTSYTYKFKVRNARMEILVQDEDTVLYTDHKNRIRINVTGKNKLGLVTLEGGALRRYGNNFVATVKEGTEAVLVVYVMKPNGKMELGLSKKYSIVHLSDPHPLIGGVKSDSIIHKLEVLKKDFLYAKMTRFKRTYRLKVLSFEMPVLIDTSVVTFNSSGDKFTPEMRRYVQRLKPGVPLSFTEIFCIMPNGKARKLKDMLVFVDCAPKYDFAK